MAHRPVGTALEQSLINGDVFSYAHLVKFEKPLQTETGASNEDAKSYAYISDGSFDITWDDGTSDINGNLNGAQTYVANRLLKVGTVSETTQARASNINLEVSSIALSTTMSTTLATTATTITALESIVDAGFSEGDTLTLSTPVATIRLDSFSNDNKTAAVTVIKGTLTVASNLSCTLTYASGEVDGILTDTNATSYAGYINREVFIYKAHIDVDTGAIIGAPYLLFKGIIATGKLTEDPTKTSKVSWGLTSHWGDFVRVNGRLTSDAEHRALDGSGNSDKLAVIRPEYGNDLGFLHSETAINIISTYQIMETRYKEKRRGGLAGLLGGKRLVEYEVEVDREVDLRFNLDAKRLPVVYGVQRIDSFPIFTDTLKDNSGKIYVAYALCEGEIGGVFDIYLDDQSSICIDKNDEDTRSPVGSPAEVLCSGRMDRGDTLSPKATSNGSYTVSYEGASFSFGNGGIAAWEASNSILNLSGINLPNATPLAVVSGGVEIGTAGGSGITHGKGTHFSTPIDTKLTLHTGKEWQLSDDLLSSIAAANNFKIQSDYFTSTGDYWGPNHQLLDTAYVVAEFTVSEGEVTIPEMEFVVKGKLLECYNYDFSYLQDSYYSSDALSNFHPGDLVTVKNSVGGATISTVRIADIEAYQDTQNNTAYRIRFKESPALGSVTAFYITDGTNNYYLATYDNILNSGSVSETLIAGATTTVSGTGIGLDVTPDAGTTSPYDSASIISDMIALGTVDLLDTNEQYEQQTILGSNWNSTWNGTNWVSVGSTQVNAASVAVAEVTIKDCIALGASASAVDNAYNGQYIEVTHKFIDNTISVQKRKIIDYVGADRIAKVDSPWTETAIPVLGDTYKIISRGDLRVSTNPSMQVLDYITNNRYGRGLDLDKDIYLDSFTNSGRVCDTRSDVTMLFPSSANATAGAVYDLVDTGGLRRFQGTLKEDLTVVTDAAGNATGYKEGVFTDVVGKIARKWNNWYEFQDGEYIWWNSNIYEIATTGVVAADPTNNLVPSSSVQPLTKISGTGDSSLSIDVASTRTTFDGNPIVKKYVPASNSYANGYSLYDSDDVKYWRYLGWNAQSQDYVTRHQTNAVVNTTKSVFENINGMLGHFNGILRYSNGKYNLSVKTGTDSFGTAQVINEDDIIGSINLEDAGQKGTYNRVSVSIPDPQNRYEGRSVAFFNSTYLRQDRNVAKKGDIKTPYITNYFNARINAKQYLEQSRKGLKATFKIGPAGLLLTAGSLIKVNNSRLGWVNKEFRVSNLNFTDNCLVQVTAEEHSAEAYLIDSIANPEYSAGENSGAGTLSIAAPTTLVTPEADSNKVTEGRVILQWTNSTNFSPDTHTVQVWRTTANDIQDASLKMVGTSKTNEFIDIPLTEDTYYYWVRYEVIPKSRTKTVFGPYNALRYAGTDTDFVFAQGASPTVSIRADNAFITYSTVGAEDPANQVIQLTASPKNQRTGANVQYKYTFTDGSATHTTSPISATTPPTETTVNLTTIGLAKPAASSSQAITVQLQEVVTNDDTTVTTTVIATDTMTLAGLQSGSQGPGGLTVIVSNEVHACPADGTGTILGGGFAGSGTTIQVFEGTNQLAVDNASPYAVSTFRVTNATTTGGVTGPTGTHSGTTFTVGDITALTSDTGTRPFTIDIVFADGTTTTVTKTQSFTRIKDADALTITGTTTANGITTISFSDLTVIPVANKAVTALYAASANPTLWSQINQTSGDYVNFYEHSGTFTVLTNAQVTALTFVKVKGEPGDSEGVIPVYASDATGSNKSFSVTDSAYTDREYVNFYEWSGTKPAIGDSRVTSLTTFVRFVGTDGAAVNIVFLRSPTLPSTPSPSATDVPAGSWTDSPTSATGLLWASKGSQANPSSNYIWSRPYQVEGTAVAELYVYNTTGGVPSGGSYNFVTGVLTPPTGWQLTPPALSGNGAAVYISVALAAGGPTDTSISMTGWSTGALFAQQTDGESAISYQLSNPAHTVACDSSGTPLAGSFVGSGTDLKVFEGNTALNFAASGTAAGTFSVIANGGTIVGTGVTPGAWSQGGSNPTYYVDLADIAAMSSTTGNITFTVIGKRLDGTSFPSFTVVQAFSKVNAGASSTTPGPTGPDGLRTVQGYIYYEKTTSGAPQAVGGTGTYSFASGGLTGLSTGVNTWTNEPRPQVPASTNTHYTAKYYGTESSAGSSTINVNFSNVVQHTSFTGVVTFSSGTTITDGSNTLTPIDPAAVQSHIGGTNVTTIDGGNIDTGTVTADRLQVGERNLTASRLLLLDDSLKIFEGTTLRVHLGNLSNTNT